MTRIIFQYECGEEMRYLSHLDLMRLFQRAMRRAALPLAYTQGYTPRPRLSLAAPKPVGITASREYGEIYLAESLSPSVFYRRLGEQLPKGMALTGAVTAEETGPSIASVVNAALYRALWRSRRTAPAPAALQKALENVLAKGEIMIPARDKKGKGRERNIRPYILSAGLAAPAGDRPALRLLLQVGSKGGLSPFQLLERLQLDDGDGNGQRWELHRLGLYIYKDDLIDPFPEGGEMCDG